MIRSLMTLFFGVVVAALIIATALLAAVWVIGMAAKAALFGEPRMSLVMKLWERANRERKTNRTDITHITPDNQQASEGS